MPGWCCSGWSIPEATLDEEHVLLVVLLDLSHEHFHKIWSAHARSRTHLPVQSVSKFFGLLVYREYQFKLSGSFSLEFAVRRELVIVGYPNGLGAPTATIRSLITVLIVSTVAAILQTTAPIVSAT